MARTPIQLQMNPGIVSDVSEFSIPGSWVDGSNFRFVNSFPEKVGGIEQQTYSASNTSTTQFNLQQIPRSALRFRTHAGGEYIALGTESALFLITNNVISNILPNNFTSTFLGNSDYAPARGFGSGRYGGGLFGQGDPESMLTFENTDWSLVEWQGDLIAVLRNGKPAVWKASGGPTTRATLIEDETGADEVPTRIRIAIATEDQFLVAMGVSQLDGTRDNMSVGDYNPMFVRWSHQSNYTQWFPTQDNLAGGVPLKNGTRIVGAVQTRGEILISTDTTIYSMIRDRDPQVIFRFPEKGTDCGFIGKNAAIDVNGTAFWMGRDGFYRYNGTVMELPCPVKHRVFDELDSGRAEKVFVSHISEFNELWWHYPSTGNLEPNKAVCYDYGNDVWFFTGFQRSCYVRNSINPQMFAPDGILWQHEAGNAGVQAFIESAPMAIDPSTVQKVSRVVPDAQFSGTSHLTLTGQDYPESVATYTRGPFTVQTGVEKIDTMLRARYLKIRIDSNDSNPVRLGTWSAITQPAGRR